MTISSRKFVAASDPVYGAPPYGGGVIIRQHQILAISRKSANGDVFHTACGLNLN